MNLGVSRSLDPLEFWRILGVRINLKIMELKKFITGGDWSLIVSQQRTQYHKRRLLLSFSKAKMVSGPQTEKNGAWKSRRLNYRIQVIIHYALSLISVTIYVSFSNTLNYLQNSCPWLVQVLSYWTTFWHMRILKDLLLFWPCTL